MSSLPPSLGKTADFKLALIQLAVTSDKAHNLSHASERVKEAASKGANVIVLPEIFNSPYGTQHFEKYAEEIPNGESCSVLKNLAIETKTFLVGGSIPERLDGKLYNTSTVWSPTGSLVATHRKVHLFDIDVPGKIRFQESETLSPGKELTSFETPFGKIGLAICYDIRFPEMAMIAARQGCIAMIYPGAFNMTTGPLHWDLLQRARATDNQFYVAACSPARDANAGYNAWGHSSIVNPKGQVIATTEEHEDIVYADIVIKEIEEVRRNIPVYTQRRWDVYDDVAGVRK